MKKQNHEIVVAERKGIENIKSFKASIIFNIIHKYRNTNVWVLRRRQNLNLQKSKHPPSLFKQYKDIHATFKEDVQPPLYTEMAMHSKVKRIYMVLKLSG